MKNLLSIFTLIGVLFLFASCDPDSDPDPEPDPDPQVFTCMIDGKPFVGTRSFNNTLLYGVNSFSGRSAKRIDIRCANAANDTTVILTFGAEPAFDSTVVCPSTTEAYEELEFGGRTSVFFTIQTGGFSTGFPVEGSVARVSRCDQANRLMDGTFEVLTQNILTNDTIEITNGVFQDIRFRVGEL
jgi:hypothetical protein